ncbi:MAG: hypothetical protein AAF725_03960 [Acidobacteriota bacterium]
MVLSKMKPVLTPEETPTGVQRLSEGQRRSIYGELVRAEDRATREAESKFPTDISRIPARKRKSYDLSAALWKNMEAEEKLRAEYIEELLKKYQLTEEELDEVKPEARQERWPLPSQ